MKTLNTIMSILVGTYLITQVACTKEPEEIKIKEPQKNYIYSEHTDNKFENASIPLDSLKAYKDMTIYMDPYNTSFVIHAYKEGFTPSVLKQYDGIFTDIIPDIVSSKVPPKYFNELNDDLKIVTGKFYDSGISAHKINKKYESYVNLCDSWNPKESPKLAVFEEIINRNIRVFDLYKYDELNEKYETKIDIFDAIFFEQEKTPFYKIEKNAKIQYYKMNGTKEKKEREMIDRIIGE